MSVASEIPLAGKFAAPAPADRSPATFDAATPEHAAAASNLFAFEMYREVAKENENVVFSPLNVSIALSMSMYGARGETQREIAQVLHVDPGASDSATTSFGRLITSLNARDGKDGLALTIADRAWGQKGVMFYPAFVSMLFERYRAPLGRVDFLQPLLVTSEINQWVTKATHGRIERIIEPRDLDPQTCLILTSTLHFKGSWVRSFDTRVTRDGDFTTPKKVSKVRFMLTQGDFNHAHVDGARLLELPYTGNLSMILVLPDVPGGLSDVERNLAANYASWLRKLAKTRLYVTFPRWKATASLVLDRPLKELGMRLAFQRDADLSGTADLHPLYISHVLHKASIDVNEEGSEAAAASAIIYTTISHSTAEDDMTFRADRPFLYFVRDATTQAILFLGRITDPAAN